MPSLTSFTPTVGDSRSSSLFFTTVVPATITLTTGGGARTLTAAELLNGLLRIDTQDAQTATTPTAALLVAAINGCVVGTAFDVDVINYGDTTLTIGLGTGVTKITVTGLAAVLTIVTAASKRLKFVCTNVTAGSEAFELYAFGSIAAAVA
jgi:hypothetical protein